jgi:uroporphyrinogen-III synthase
MRVLVTRPAEDAARTAKRLAACGHKAVLAPLLTVSPSGETAPGEASDGFVVTSAHAVGPLCELVAAASRPKRPVFAVGARSAEVLRQAGFARVRSAGADARALAELIRAELPPGARLVHVAGRDRKAEPEASLRQAGFAVRVWVAYEATRAARLPGEAVRARADDALDAALHYSRRSAAILVELATEAGLLDRLRRLVHVCLSEDVAAPLAKAQAGRLVVAQRPDEDALLAALEAALRMAGSPAGPIP